MLKMALRGNLPSKSFLGFISHCVLILPPTCANPTDRRPSYQTPSVNGQIPLKRKIKIILCFTLKNHLCDSV